MSEIDPRVRRIRRMGVGVFLGASALAVPVGLHIHRTSATPELGLTLLGAVLLLVLIALFALETAVTPIPEPRYTAEDAEGKDLDPTECSEESAHLTEVIVPSQPAVDTPLTELATELISQESPGLNRDGPMLTVPHPSLAHAETRLSDTEIDDEDSP